MTKGNIDIDVAGGPMRHIPVMLNEVLECLRPAAHSQIVDGTFGAGGYSRAILESGASVLAIDRDPDAIAAGAEFGKDFPNAFKLVKGEFGSLDTLAQEAGFEKVDGVVLDIGVSSMQLDEAERGFSFRNDGPLDMRMARAGVSAADVVNCAAQGDLTRIIGILGEEKQASRISREIVKSRAEHPISTTRELVSIVERVIRRRPQDRIHPATRTFQALRIFVNRELEQLCKALFAAERLLIEGGRLVVVTFHSLEDRIVKQFFRDRSGTQQGSRHLPVVNHKDATFAIEGNGLVKASAAEADANPRARSAKLRWGTRTRAGSRNADFSMFGLPDLTDPDRFPSEGVL